MLAVGEACAKMWSQTQNIAADSEALAHRDFWSTWNKVFSNCLTWNPLTWLECLL
jgi:hypothetical protein